MELSEFDYRIPWRAQSPRPGHHRSRRAGGGLEFRDRVPFLGCPDPRRIDLRASVRDPREQLLVRVFNQQSAITVHALADLSASMDFRGAVRKLDVLGDFTAAAAFSAYRTGDPFAFSGFDAEVRRDFVHPPSRERGLGLALAARLRGLSPAGADSRGILAAARLVGRRPALVFLVSDFHFPLPLLARALEALALHQVVPVVLCDSAEDRALPRFGLARVVDRETGRQRTLWFRRALRERMRRALAARREALNALCVAHGAAPLYLHDGFRADSVTRYFHA